MENNRNAPGTFFIVFVAMCLILSSCNLSRTTPLPPGLTSTPIPSNTPALTSPALPTITFTPAVTINSTWTRPADGMTMVYVPEGIFSMGSTRKAYEQPVHNVYLDAYWIDRTEVTNAMYAQCEQAGACTWPGVFKSNTRSNYYKNSEYANYPVIYVNWKSAQAYCKWAGARLPTEAEWEKAARGTDGKHYPWGDSPPGKDLLNFNSNVGDTTAVGSYPSGASPYGALDMSGNVYEWVADWFSVTYYANSPSSNPQGPATGLYRVRRGGSWASEDNLVSSTYRLDSNPHVALNDIGFRCARSDVTPAPSVTPITTPTCPVCTTAVLTGRQTVCSAKCRAARARQQQDAIVRERNARVRLLLTATIASATEALAVLKTPD